MLYLDYCTHQDVAARLHKELMVKNEPYAKLIENLNSELRTSFDFRPPLPEHAYEHLADGSLRPEDNRLQFTDYLITVKQHTSDPLVTLISYIFSSPFSASFVINCY